MRGGEGDPEKPSDSLGFPRILSSLLLIIKEDNFLINVVVNYQRVANQTDEPFQNVQVRLVHLKLYFKRIIK